MANLIDIEHLSKSYGKNKVLEDIRIFPSRLRGGISSGCSARMAAAKPR